VSNTRLCKSPVLGMCLSTCKSPVLGMCLSLCKSPVLGKLFKSCIRHVFINMETSYILQEFNETSLLKYQMYYHT
jgi:hypothetical protein